MLSHWWRAGLLVVAIFGQAVAGCTLIVASGGATKDGSAMVAHTDDAGFLPSDLRLVRVPAMHHDELNHRPVYPTLPGGYPRLVSHARGPAYAPKDDEKLTAPLGHIPQVEHTYAYWDNEYGLMNEKGLAMGETTCSSKLIGWPIGQPGGRNLFSVSELSRVALERCSTARCAIATMGKLAEKYGFHGDDNGTPDQPDYQEAAEALGVIDATGEAWVFHVMTGPHHKGAVWAARRVPDGQVAVLANGFVIRHLDLSDPTHYLASRNVFSVAEDEGWWKRGQPFDFTAVYGFFNEDGGIAVNVGRRTWRVYDLMAPSLKLDSRLGWMKYPTYPFAITPDDPLTLGHVRRILRDHYEGTPYDLTKGVAAGPFGNPVRLDALVPGGGFERAISIFRADYSYIAQARPHMGTASGILWYGPDCPHVTTYLPFYAAQSALPESFENIGRQSEFSLDSAWWAFNLVNNWMQLKFSFMSRDVREHQEQVEQRAEKRVTEWDRHIRDLGTDSNAARRYLNHRAPEFAQDAVQQQWKLAFKLLAKYSNGNVVLGEQQETVPGHSVDWLKLTGYFQFPGNTLLRTPPIDEKAAVESHVRSAQWPLFTLGLILSLTLAPLLFTAHRVRSAYLPLP